MKASGLARLRPAGSEVRINTATTTGFAGNKPRLTGESLSANPQIFRGRFASVLHFFIAHLGTLIEVAQAGSFHGRDVHKHVLAAVVG